MTPTAVLTPEVGTLARAEQAGEGAIEELLIQRCVRGETECFRPLVERHQRMAFAVAMRLLGTRADAQDVAQSAFVDAFRALDRFEGNGRPNAFRVWLMRIVVNRAKDVLKSKKRTESSLAGEVLSEDAMFAHVPSDPERAAEHHEDREALTRALADLPIKYRECLVLKDVEELSYEDMRAILRLPITTLKIRVVRARAFVRAALERGTKTKKRNRDETP